MSEVRYATLSRFVDFVLGGLIIQATVD